MEDSQKAIWDTTMPKIVMHEQVTRDGLDKYSIGAYAVGHFSNDLCAAAWFTYVLFYVEKVVKLNDFIAGFVILSGQIADAITTPIVGFYSDKIETKIGKR
jgi:Na+/melibiose symporter-like transporter